MTILRHFLVVVLVSLIGGLGGVAWGEGIVLPDVAETGCPIPLRIDATIPDGATVLGPGWMLPDTLSGKHKYDVSKNLVIVAQLTPGKYEIRYECYWYHTEPIEVFDANGNKITVLQFLGAGHIHDTATLTITGDPGPDPPDPPDPPTPGGPYQIMLMFDGDQLDNLPREQRDLLTSLSLRQRLVASGHVLLEVLEAGGLGGSVPPAYQPWVNAVKGDPMPRVALAPKDGGTIKDYALPENETDLMKLLENPR